MDQCLVFSPRSTSIQGLHRNTFNQNGGNPNSKYALPRTHGEGGATDYNHNNLHYATSKRPANVYHNTEELCEFQVRQRFR